MPGSPQATSIVYWTIEDGRDQDRRPDPEDIVGRHYRSRQSAEAAIAEFLRWDAPHRLATNRLRLEWISEKQIVRALKAEPRRYWQVVFETRLAPDLPFEFYVGITGGEDGLVQLRRPAEIRWLQKFQRTERKIVDGQEYAREVTDVEELSPWEPLIVEATEGTFGRPRPKAIHWTYPLWISRDELKLEP